MKSIYTPPFLFVFLFILSFAFTATHAQDFQWAKRGGSTNTLQRNQDNNNILDMVTDASGNLYMLSRVGAYNLTVDGNSLPAYSAVGNGASNDILLSSFSKEGSYRWSKVIGSSPMDRGTGLKVQNGSVHISGYVLALDSAFFGTDSFYYHAYNGYYPKMAFLIQYDTLGVFQWLQMPGAVDSILFSSGNKPENSYWIDIAPNGDIYWLCDLVPGCLPNTLQPITQKGTYVLRYSSSGQYLSRVQLSTEHYGDFRFSGLFNEGNFIRDHQNGRFYLGGTYDYAGKIVIGGDTLKGSMYLACFDSNGQVVWKKESGSTKNSFNNAATSLNDFQLNSNGDLLLTGTTRSGDTLFDGLIASSSNTSVSPMVMKMSSSGSVLWHKMGVVQGVGHSYGIVQNGAEMAIAGSHVGLYWQGSNDEDTLHSVPNQGYDAYIARFDLQNGDLLGMQSAETNFGSVSYGYSITADSEGSYYLGGNFSAQLYLGPDTLYKLGSQRSFFVTKYACTMPESDFDIANDSTGYTFAYTGTEADSIHWDFGDGSPIKAGDTITHAYASKGQYIVCATSYDACGDTTFCDTVDVMTINLYEQMLGQVSVYPNPTNNLLYLENLPKHSSVKLFNLNGKLLLQEAFKDEKASLDLSQLSKGVYLLELQNNSGESEFRKVMKE